MRELQEELARLRQDVTRLSEEQRHTWELLLALKPDIRLAVMRELREIKTEELVLRAAQRHEELLKWEDRRKVSVSKTQPSPNKPAVSGRGSGNAPAKSQQNESKPSTGGQQSGSTRGASHPNPGI
jgi:hypothetical protein